MTGGPWKRTFTVNLPCVTFGVGLFRSAEVQSTVVVPTGKVEPEAGVQVTGVSPSI